ncbi:MAG: glutamyl-tRNA reductase [Candidatus Methanosuratincola sp.]|jgi:glutamyl-tRNA reductase|nr:glutamyl-tRNA reductase [Candidatus Methanosuratincola sp.]
MCLSISHKKAPVRVLESFALDDIKSSLLKLRDIGAEESVLIQTCHRVEIYSVGTRLGRKELESFLASESGSNLPIELYGEFYDGEEAVRHLFYLASGLESVILGENEVLHQVEDSMRIAREAGTLGRALETAFRGAINAGRVVRRRTAIARGSVSLGNIVMKAISLELGSLDGKKLVIIGAGKIGCLIAKALPRKGPITIFIANRTYARAEKLAEAVGGSAVRFENIRETLSCADAVICATSSPHLVLRLEDIQPIVTDKSLLVVDVSNPRGVDERIGELSGVKLIDLDQIMRIARENMRFREAAVMTAREIIAPSLAIVMERLMIGDRKQRFEEIMRWAEGRRQAALEVAIKRGAFSEEQVKVIDDFSYALMRDLIAPFFNTENSEGGI